MKRTPMNRVNIQQVQPDGYTALLGLERWLAKAALPVRLMELVRLRASQINACKFCLALHTETARKQGESDKRLDALANWRNSDVFDEKERCALAVTEAVTSIGDNGLPDALYHKASLLFSEQEMSQLIVLIATINAWNRIGIATGLPTS